MLYERLKAFAEIYLWSRVWFVPETTVGANGTHYTHIATPQRTDQRTKRLFEVVFSWPTSIDRAAVFYFIISCGLAVWISSYREYIHVTWLYVRTYIYKVNTLERRVYTSVYIYMYI